MKHQMFVRSAVFAMSCLLALVTSAKEINFRLTEKQDSNAQLSHLLEVLNQQTSINLSSADFVQLEEVTLATSQFTLWQQVYQGVAVKGKFLRRWVDPKNQKLIQFEATVSDLSELPTLLQSRLLLQRKSQISATESLDQVRALIANSEDSIVGKTNIAEEWVGKDILRQMDFHAKRGIHRVIFSLNKNQILSHTYREYPQVDSQEIAAKAFLIWEEEGNGTPPVQPIPVTLKYLQNTIRRPTTDPYVELNQRRFLQDYLDPVKALDPVYQQQGYWSFPLLNSLIGTALQKWSDLPNTYGANGLVLHGTYASINVVPEAMEQFQGIQIPKSFSPVANYDWVPTPEDKNKREMKVRAPYLGRVFNSQAEIDQLEIRRDPKHDPVYYLNNGFDQIQVYYAINQMFESLWGMGFSDPELSTRRFDAYLYNPDIGSQNNAFYSDDTINFSTYTPKAQNFARDNTTVWHELGHGIMDRLMGPYLDLDGAGGLSEGMADFVAQMVLNHVHIQDFPGKYDQRIFNNTSFYLTNEEHDDGEAYGGAMNEIMLRAIAVEGPSAVAKVTDLTLEAMRLSRNHPKLAAKDWFQHMIFADERGSERRAPGEFNQLILSALADRNFSLSEEAPAQMDVLIDGTAMVMDGAGTRYKPVQLKLKENQTKSFQAQVRLKNSSFFQFKFPVTIKAQYQGSPLQGAIHWEGEENGAQVVVLKSENDFADFNLTVSGRCDAVNGANDSCKDYVHFQVFNNGTTDKPQAKKRFYVKQTPKK